MRETPSIAHVLRNTEDNDKDNKETPKKSTPWYLNTFLTNFFAGGTSASVAVTAIAPFERIKLLLQVQRSAKNISREEQYKGILDCFRRIPKEQGFLSFWRGNSASVLRCFPYQALNFSVKDKLRERFHKSIDMELLSHRMISNLLAGGLAGAFALSVIYPLDYARTRLAVDIGGAGTGRKREFQNIRHALTYTFKTEGRAGIYRGFYFSVIGVFVYRSIYFGIFDTSVEMLPPVKRHNFWVQFLIAEIAAISGSTLSYPLDTVRRSMMMQSGRAVKLYKGSWDCYRKIYAKYGLTGFYHGGLANVVRGTGGASMLILYDKAQHYFAHLTAINTETLDTVSKVTPEEPERIYRELPSGLINEKKPKSTERRFHFCLF